MVRVILRGTLVACAFLSAGLTSSKAAATVDALRELLIVHPSVVDPFLNGGRSHNGTVPPVSAGPWSLRHLLRMLSAGVPASQRDAFYSSFFERWLADQTADNGSIIPHRELALVRSLVLDQFSYVDQATGKRVFEMWKLPFELTAIAYRPDLRAADGSDAGELRFVYKLIGPDGTDQKFTLIMEYKMGTFYYDARTWAHNFDRLGTMEVGSEEYLKLLEKLTWYHTTVTVPEKPMLRHIRTNEIALAGPGGVWQMRQFDQHRTSLTASEFVPSAVQNTPARAFNNTQALADFVSANPILGASGTGFMDFVMPSQINLGAGPVPFLDGFSEVGINWTIPGEAPGSHSVAVDNLGLLTCNGCHQDNKTTPRDVPGSEISFYHVRPDISPGQDGVARLSKFLTTPDATKPDRRPGELARRVANFNQLLNEPWSPIWIDF